MWDDLLLDNDTKCDFADMVNELYPKLGVKLQATIIILIDKVAEAQLTLVKQELCANCDTPLLREGELEQARGDGLEAGKLLGAKEGREQVKTWLLNHMCHIGQSSKNYVYLGNEYIKQCRQWDGKP